MERALPHFAPEEEKPGDKRFFRKNGPFTLAQIYEAMGDAAADTPPLAEDQASRLFEGVAPLHTAGPDDISFLDNRRYLPLLAGSRAGAVVMGPGFADQCPPQILALLSGAPYLAWSRIARLFYPPTPSREKRHPAAFVSDQARIGRHVEIGAFAVIESGAVIGDGCVIGSHAVLGAGVRLGRQCRIGTHVSLTHCLLGDGVVIYPGARIGQDGFGFAVGPESFETIPQLGRVILEDGVEVGANSTIDRGSMRDTVIGAGTRIDNLVQIGHNARLGRCCIIVAQAGISGSTELEDFVTVAAQAGLVGHIHIGKKARIGAQCGVMSDIEAGADVIGSPALPLREYFRNVATLRKLSRKARG